ncbi:Mss4-like protein [Amylocystis lapponica]|nr:Mss4-like protein [Amylocystis lapponica]
MSSDSHVEPNAHPDAPIHNGPQYTIPHPPPEDHAEPTRLKAHPDTGWRGQPPIPSREGGKGDPNFLHKPPYTWKSEGDLFKPKYTTQCWCGNVSFEFHGDPLDAKHCHCRQCQQLHGAPFQWAVIFPKGEHSVPCKVRTPHSRWELGWSHPHAAQVSCDVCRSPIFDEGRNTVLAYPASFKFPDHKVPRNFQPSAHIFYSQRTQGESELLQELTEEEGMMPKYKGRSEGGQIDPPSGERE